jgi:hypothetical protein
MLLKAIAGGFASLAALALAASEGSLKSVVDSWLGGCVIVVQKSIVDHGKGTTIFVVELIPSNAELSKLPITFKTTGKRLAQVDFEKEISRGNYALHPDANQGCPGGLCLESEDEIPVGEMTLVLDPFSAAFAYRFRITVNDAANGTVPSAEDLDVFATYTKTTGNTPFKACRMELAEWYNVLAWASPEWRIAILVVLVLVLSVGLTFAKAKQ